MTRTTLACFAALALLPAPTFAADFAKAVLLRRHGLPVEAKQELIDLICEKDAPAPERAKAYYLLGTIAFEENSIAAAQETWSDLIELHPTSPEAERAREMVKGLEDIFGERRPEVLASALATSCLAYADLWSRGKDEVFHADLRGIDRVDAAVRWYDRVIREFPESRAAELAYVGKLRTLFGWAEPGQYKSSYGLRSDAADAEEIHMPLIHAALEAFERSFPAATSLQAFRYQIAQYYWRAKDWESAQAWLKRVVEKGKADSFYVDLARRRLEKLKD